MHHFEIVGNDFYEISTIFDPFLEYDISDTGDDIQTFKVRVSSVINYSKIFPQHSFQGVYWDLDYELIVSITGHEVNQSAIV